MSQGHKGIQHDETKTLIKKLGEDVLELSKNYSKEEVTKLPQEVLKEAEVSNVSKKGTTAIDRDLAKKRVINAGERKARSRKTFPSIQDLEKSARAKGIDNDHNWEYVDEKNKRR